MNLLSLIAFVVTGCLFGCIKPKPSTQPLSKQMGSTFLTSISGCSRHPNSNSEPNSSTIKMYLADSDSEKIEIEYGDWCEDKKESEPPKKDEVERCWNDPKISNFRTCLENVIASAKIPIEDRLKWPDPADMKKCGCEVYGEDTQTSQMGRTLYECEGDTGEGLKVSPFVGDNGAPNLGIMGLPPADNPGCMFDVGGTPPKPLSNQENCFGCHPRSEPEGPSSTPCPDAKKRAPLQ